MDLRQLKLSSNDQAAREGSIVAGFLTGQRSGDWSAFKDAWSRAAGVVHGHAVTDLQQRKDGSFVATLDDGTRVPISDASHLLTEAIRMASSGASTLGQQ